MFKYLCEFANLEVTQVKEGIVVPVILDSLSLSNDNACVHPDVVWERLLSIVLMYNCKIEAEVVRVKTYLLLEKYIIHYFSIHPDTSISKTNCQSLQETPKFCSATDSDSAFFDPTTHASDISMEDTSMQAEDEPQSNTI